MLYRSMKSFCLIMNRRLRRSERETSSLRKREVKLKRLRNRNSKIELNIWQTNQSLRRPKNSRDNFPSNTRNRRIRTSTKQCKLGIRLSRSRGNLLPFTSRGLHTLEGKQQFHSQETHHMKKYCSHRIHVRPYICLQLQTLKYLRIALSLRISATEKQARNLSLDYSSTN